MQNSIPFIRNFRTRREIEYVTDVVTGGSFSSVPLASGYRGRCEEALSSHYRGGGRGVDVILTQSCTVALEMAAMLCGVGPGDEVVLPSYTFSSTANAFALRGAALVFVDIDPQTLNIDPAEVEKAVTPRTKAIVCVDYAGHPCDMKSLRSICDEHGLALVEDAAQSYWAFEHDRPVGTQADLAALSFHNTKNIHCGAGGALIINSERHADRAAILAEKGTNRKRFFLGQVDKYSWVDIGTSALPSELTSAMLLSQLEMAEEITNLRRTAWMEYAEGLSDIASEKGISLPYIAAGVKHNAHMFYLLLENRDRRDSLIRELRNRNISAPFHYIPLHSSAAGRKFGRAQGELAVTNRVASSIIRLPLWPGVPTGRVIQAVRAFVKGPA